MNHSNGHVKSSATNEPAVPSLPQILTPAQFTADQMKDLLGRLEMPFDPSLVDWRVVQTAQAKKNGNYRGKVIPYADQRAYIDRLNALFSPAGWTRRYTVHTSANFQRSKDQATTAKVFVACELIIFGLGQHAATGEQWADDENAGTSAEAQAFKRACACFGLGRYLYYFTGVWVNLDERKRPRKTPKLTDWATPEGWQKGLRPWTESSPNVRGTPDCGRCSSVENDLSGQDKDRKLIGQIEAMGGSLGKGLYRGILKSVAKVWNPADVRDVGQLAKILSSMQAAERALTRLEVALESTGPQALVAILHSLDLERMEQVTTVQLLDRIVAELEGQARNIGS